MPVLPLGEKKTSAHAGMHLLWKNFKEFAKRERALSLWEVDACLHKDSLIDPASSIQMSVRQLSNHHR